MRAKEAKGLHPQSHTEKKWPPSRSPKSKFILFHQLEAGGFCGERESVLRFGPVEGAGGNSKEKVVISWSRGPSDSAITEATFCILCS